MDKTFGALCAFLAAISVPGSAAAAEGDAAKRYPQRPVRMVVGFAPGGGTDVVARILAGKFSEAFGQTFIVDNRPGAGSNIGTELVAKATPDGHTLLVTVSSLAINVSLYAKLGYDPVRDFSPVSVVTLAPNMIVAHPNSGVASAKELVAAARAKPGFLTYGSPGSGTAQHLAMELFTAMAGIKLVHIPFNGGGPATTAALGGQTNLMGASLPTGLPHVRSGRLRSMGVTSATRTPLAPDLATIAEAAGLPGYEANVWYGMLAPAGTPRGIIDRLNAEVEKVVQGKDVRERFVGLGFDPHRNTPEQFHELIRSDIVKWGKVIRDSGAKAD